MEQNAYFVVQGAQQLAFVRTSGTPRMKTSGTRYHAGAPLRRAHAAGGEQIDMMAMLRDVGVGILVGCIVAACTRGRRPAERQRLAWSGWLEETTPARPRQAG